MQKEAEPADDYRMRYRRIAQAVARFHTRMSNLPQGSIEAIVIEQANAAFNLYAETTKAYCESLELAEVGNNVEKLIQTDLLDFEGFRIKRERSHLGAVRDRLNTDDKDPEPMAEPSDRPTVG